MEKTINFSNLVINVQEQDELVVYTFDGDVDENFRQEQVPRIQKKKIILEATATFLLHSMMLIWKF